MLSAEEEFSQVKKAQEDISCFEPLYNKYYLPIFYFLSKRTFNKDLAGEITAEVFLKALENIKKFKFQGLPFAPWLYRIAVNTLNDRHRKNASFRVVDVTTVQLEEITSEIEPHDKEELEERMEQMQHILTQLDADDILMIEMRYFEKRRFKEIAEILDITEESARVKSHRIMQKMKGMLNLKVRNHG
jgi:RNA polymerase sigma-70 factor (ECF subfamily)